MTLSSVLKLILYKFWDSAVDSAAKRFVYADKRQRLSVSYCPIGCARLSLNALAF